MGFNEDETRDRMFHSYMEEKGDPSSSETGPNWYDQRGFVEGVIMTKLDQCGVCLVQLTGERYCCDRCSNDICPDCQINIDDWCYCNKCWEDDVRGIFLCKTCVEKFTQEFMVVCLCCGHQFCWFCMTSFYKGYRDDLCPDCFVIPIICPQCRFEASRIDINWFREWCSECWNADNNQERKSDLDFISEKPTHLLPFRVNNMGYKTKKGETKDEKNLKNQVRD